MATKKTKKGPGPNPIPPELRAHYREQVIKGLGKAAKVVVPMVGATVAMFKRKPEEKIEQRGKRQERRSEIKAARAEKLATTAPKRSARLTKKAENLKTKSAANLKAADIIYKSKNK
jgi:hypothetical protein